MELRSLGDMLRDSCRKYADRTAMLVPAKGGHQPITYKDLYEKVYLWAAAVHSLGLTKGDRLVILSENCPEWAFADWACQTLGIIVVPIYPTLPADQAEYIVLDSGAKVVLAGDANQAKKTECTESVRTMLLKDAEGSLQDIAERQKPPLDRAEWERIIDSHQIDEIATIVYTSGTTGLPKGAMLANRGFLTLFHNIVRTLPLGASDTFLTFLPMSHIFERTDGQYLPISFGGTVGFSKSLATLANDMVAVKPTVMLVVPRFLEATMDKILDGVRKQPPLRQKLFHLGLAQGKKRFRGEFAPLAFLTDKLVGQKIRDRVGGRLRFFVSGGAALPWHVVEFYAAFGLPIMQGYGLTETYSGVCINHPDRNRPETVGEPIEGVEVKLAEDGEILFRGAARMVGYYNLPKETSEAIDEEGWFHTGDIGEFDGTYLKITDRKKDLLVLGNGKNVAPQPIENKLRSSKYITEAVVLGDGMEYCIALIVPNDAAVRSALSLPEDQVLSQSAEAKALIKKEIEAINKTLAPFEMVKKHALIDRPFTVESGEMTPSFKVKRKVVKDNYKELIDSMR